MTHLPTIVAAARRSWEEHPAVRTGADLTFGERLADRVRNAFGSWAFIAAQTIIIAIWIAINVVAAAWRWDPYPFILLNLMFSTQAAYAAPIILLSQRRADAISSETAAADLESDKRSEKMLAELTEMHAHLHEQMKKLTALLAALTPAGAEDR